MAAFGSTVLYLVLVSAALTFAVAVAAGAHPRLLRSARLFAYTTACLVVLDVAILAYCFQTHDFSVRYVHRYSDRTMSPLYLLSALWGGQDGSLLWWLFLLALYTAACLRWLRQRYLSLQPYIIATIMVVTMFFAILMAFSANPFETYWSGVPEDGKGLNPLLQNFYMIFHPPSLYMGFIGCTIPFAFAMAALISGRLHEEWLWACRRWILFAWIFLSLGNILGALWAYEELGWGGYWAWDPVENAAFMPWLTATAFVHSVMIQERRGMLKVWNLFLPIFTFAMTIFGTFLTRAGLISSVHSFAQSGIGVFFIYFLIAVGLTSLVLVLWRWRLLKGDHQLESLASREAIFVFNNWILLAAMVVILALTTFPLLTEALADEKVTVGPNFFTFFMLPIVIVLVVLMAVGTVIPWRKANLSGLLRALKWPIALGLAAGLSIVVLGGRLGFPPYVEILGDVIETIKAAWLRAGLRAIYGVTPVVSAIALVFALAVVVQEFWRGTAMRRRNTKEPVWLALLNMVGRARRRYGGYFVHVGFIIMVFGMMGSAYKVEKEAPLQPRQSIQLWDYRATYLGIQERDDPGKNMVFARVRVTRGGRDLGVLEPAKFVYRTHPDMPTTEVAIRSSARDDLYLVLGAVDRDTGSVSIKLIVNPLTVWIWVGGLLMMLGTVIAIWPDVARIPRGAARAAAIGAAVLIVLAPGLSAAQQHDSGSTPLPVGTVEMNSGQERTLFGQMLCMCGDCARLSLAVCTCGVADDYREQVRARLARGQSPQAVLDWYEGMYGPEALATPPGRGFFRAAWVFPPLAVVLGAGLVFWIVRRWRTKERLAAPPPSAGRASTTSGEPDEYAKRVEEELRSLDD